MKKTAITDVEIACLRGMITENVPVATMAKQLDRSVTSITKEVAALKAQAERESLFLTKSAGGQEGISIMTEAASTKGDMARERHSPPSITRSPWVHKIRPDGKK